MENLAECLARHLRKEIRIYGSMTASLLELERTSAQREGPQTLDTGSGNGLCRLKARHARWTCSHLRTWAISE